MVKPMLKDLRRKLEAFAAARDGPESGIIPASIQLLQQQTEALLAAILLQHQLGGSLPPGIAVAAGAKSSAQDPSPLRNAEKQLSLKSKLSLVAAKDSAPARLTDDVAEEPQANKESADELFTAVFAVAGAHERAVACGLIDIPQSHLGSMCGGSCMR